jgi:hypothetical protein
MRTRMFCIKKTKKLHINIYFYGIYTGGDEEGKGRVVNPSLLMG